MTDHDHDYTPTQAVLDMVGPKPTTLRERLNHAIHVYKDAPNDMQVLLCTSNVYGRGVKTELTLGDIRDVGVVLDNLSRMDDD